ncbi:MAG: hypothetical protein ABL867_08695, partial [Rickettsiales bacterium]
MFFLAKKFRKSDADVNNSPKWHYVYYILAAFNVFTVAASFYMHDNLVNLYENSANFNAEWSFRQKKLLELGNTSVAMNAPGNDLFISKDIKKESDTFN